MPVNATVQAWADSDKKTAVLEDLKRAVDFFDKVQAATSNEKIAVGTDHWDWLISAARAVRQAL